MCTEHVILYVRADDCVIIRYYISTSNEYIFIIPAKSVPLLLSKFLTQNQANDEEKEL